MNITYLIINAAFLLYGIIQFSTGAFDSYNFLRWFSALISSIVGGAMLVGSFVGYSGEDLIEIKPATNTRIGNELIIQAEGYPTQVVNTINLIDKKVQIKKTIKQNALGGDVATIYEIEEVK